MPIYKINKKTNFTTIDNNIFKNNLLSFKATGLLATMLSLPDNWDFSETGLATLKKDNLKAIKSALKELEEQGYLVRNRVRDSKGRLKEIVYDVYEEPICHFQTLENPTLEKDTQLNTNIIKDLNNKENNNNKLLLSKNFKKPTLEEVREYCRERSNTIDAEYFIDYYESKGWLVGRTKMKDWKAAIRLWEHKSTKKVDKQKEIDEMCKRLAYLDEEN